MCGWAHIRDVQSVYPPTIREGLKHGSLKKILQVEEILSSLPVTFPSTVAGCDPMGQYRVHEGRIEHYTIHDAEMDVR